MGSILASVKCCDIVGPIAFRWFCRQLSNLSLPLKTLVPTDAEQPVQVGQRKIYKDQKISLSVLHHISYIDHFSAILLSKVTQSSHIHHEVHLHDHHPRSYNYRDSYAHTWPRECSPRSPR